MTPVLDIAVRRRLGAFSLDAAFTSNGRLTALFGSSGSGKTSLINVISGLIRPESGHVRVDGETLVDTAKGVFLPTHRRRIGYVFQEARLFPHLTVRQNLLFGHWFVPRAQRRPAELDRVLDLLGIGHLTKRRPGALSGGEKQRVAIGRALLAQPRLLLMDEPLAALDEARKAEILPHIERLRDEAGIPIVYVSHALAEVARLATTIAMVEGGRILACGPTAEILSRPDLAARPGAPEASTLLAAEVTGFDEAFGLARLATPAGPLTVARGGLSLGQRIGIRILASDVMLSLSRPAGISALNLMPGTVSQIGARSGAGGSTVHLLVACGEAKLAVRLTAKSVDLLGLAPGKPVHAVIKSVSVEMP
ncbi:molybdenum ABC transporter ATP-binding protein [Bosea sp. (in: a-proteobacteria)]|uniref:molybdenum ABC transporter ATP-binding protein n=1 Tax=Bosea sp. (in: a-proteobacteria) TaxID=1871050 RepID=UPI00260480DB|nr:molybdenum ABC transporter ATP-binding protein [Bosea sp. (in: a-proteobacteria)]MCO5093304.1 molybdenum ABC transporter ATP-binding protein [Bosea sp. (in: a-proteobacteria)]